eukprot:tig00000310_g24004.t1
MRRIREGLSLVDAHAEMGDRISRSMLCCGMPFFGRIPERVRTVKQSELDAQRRKEEERLAGGGGGTPKKRGFFSRAFSRRSPQQTATPGAGAGPEAPAPAGASPGAGPPLFASQAVVPSGSSAAWPPPMAPAPAPAVAPAVAAAAGARPASRGAQGASPAPAPQRAAETPRAQLLGAQRARAPPPADVVVRDFGIPEGPLQSRLVDVETENQNQDAMLDQIDSALGRLVAMGRDMGDALTAQGAQAGEMSGQADRTRGRVGNLSRRVGRL